MNNFWLLSIILVLVLAAGSPLATARSSISCGHRVYAANSTYEANFRRLAAVFPDELASAPYPVYMIRALGYWPNRLEAVSDCWNGGADCAACIADAFKQVELECPYRRESTIVGDRCVLQLVEFRIFGRFGDDALVMMLFQGAGLASLVFLLLMERRPRSRDPTSNEEQLPVAGDQL